MIKYAEKRDFLRMPIDCELNFTEVGGSESYSGKVINLSTQGILFSAGRKFEVGSRLEIVLTPSNSITPPMRARVKVARVEPRESLFDIAGEIEQARS